MFSDLRNFGSKTSYNVFTKKERKEIKEKKEEEKIKRYTLNLKNCKTRKLEKENRWFSEGRGANSSLFFYKNSVKMI
ncbi:MAG: hypothetical protein COV30_01800 [Candidatus Yanofskybacteria bacterium CG10_big_fil_rev_8_21_14_0_10_37_15]|uniref:Uncharacterized protein n=1 Tax=Candidatus Yanofskybacteria bacterium CG10_big_fil_rev_8_21_14_0_10_37_15 TaxID=1975097 RepID=A0A2H0R5K7_9BACT|nr:MAG: hypothetical protein COV30_01800 [Candidatus Yanofskybacteria bacterium CG10_big_fil_rev_8_21_14_0_10_37_15]